MEINNNNKPAGVCQVCGDIGIKESIMTCFNCRDIREHTYCAEVMLRSVPDMWLCQVCRSSTRVLHIPNHVDSDVNILNQTTSNDGSKSFDRLMFLANVCHDHEEALNDTASSKKQEPQFQAFPSPTRKRRSVSSRRRRRF